MSRVVCLVLLGLILPSTGFAQAWTRDQGRTYANLSFSWLSSDTLYNPDFSKRELPTQYSQMIVALYGEVGLIDRWLTLSVNSELFRRSALEDQGSTYGLGDTKLGLWSGIVVDPVRVTLGVDFGLPTGDSEPDAGAGTDATAQGTARSLPTGDGEFDIEPRILVGTSVTSEAWPVDHYFVASVGYAIRTSASLDGVRESFADGVTYSVEVGTQIPSGVLKRFWWTVRFFGVESFADDEDAAQGAVGLGNGVTYTSFGFGVLAHIYEGLGASVHVDTALRARSIISAVPIRVGLSYEY